MNGKSAPAVGYLLRGSGLLWRDEMMDTKVLCGANSYEPVSYTHLMGMMTLCLTAGEAITVVAEGDDEEQAVSEIEKYLKNQE